MNKNSNHIDQIENLFKKRAQKIKPGLDRMHQAMEILHLSSSSLPPCMLIAGTNGKGSTAGFLWHLLAATGLRCGLFTSPHLVSFAERIQCSHVEVTLDLLIAELEQVQKDLSSFYEELSFFEVSTLLGFRMFKKMECDLMVLEVGLGGRWDATNVLEPLLSAVVSIGFDHQEWLGYQLSEIATEKLGVARAHRPLFWGPAPDINNDLGIENILQKKHRQENFILFRQSDHFSLQSDKFFMNLPFCHGTASPAQSFSLPPWVQSAPLFLQKNFVLAFAMFCEAVQAPELQVLFTSVKGLESVPSTLAEQALQSFAHPHLPWPVSLSARFQMINIDKSLPIFLSDVCHNVPAVTEFVASLKNSSLASQIPLPGLVSILADKDLNQMLDLLREVLSPLYLFQVKTERSFSRENLAERHRDLEIFESFDALWTHISLSSAVSPKPHVVCGSFYAVSSFMDYFQIPPLS
ncbi:MAG: hypothetical protein KA436_04970 [Oligoflexales bacterium]|nr:hypothetical protein [Oligoflexales bacterium]